MSQEEIIAEKKKAIFASTLELVRENGFHGTPMSLVAKKAGVAAGTIYHYFESKDALIIALYSYLRGKMAEEMLRDDDQTLDYQTRFFNLWKKHFHYFLRHTDVLYFFEQFVNSPYYERCPEKGNDRCQNIIATFLNEGMEKGFLKQMNGKLMSILVNSSVVTSAKIHLTGKVEITETELQQVAQYVWDGIRNNQGF
ncbi:TetR/AcrR family transcriptional regulator [Adhaeribacter sp. BT258]|uniref:TetR/AcrR family transcriptional regulator n=1 Tax=Adhaeribacter terrigena TaxID=2793070 RepID=A0ABS1C1Y9_9BACT|nr:TetR/AcrR family transcriptional regulator [Adhaeribacter terrigena]MBK0403191.1 TetR/AcrR family transcriptional regulator [Adhaeribacter terrigena]